ncbi:hypothetical protein HDG33_000601 [Paraburkholderia sp. Cpub6]|nr:hypothetical protein [Paraburkholderia sp. Cpub6]
MRLLPAMLLQPAMLPLPAMLLRPAMLLQPAMPQLPAMLLQQAMLPPVRTQLPTVQQPDRCSCCMQRVPQLPTGMLRGGISS